MWAVIGGQDVDRLPSASTCYNTLKVWFEFLFRFRVVSLLFRSYAMNEFLQTFHIS